MNVLTNNMKNKIFASALVLTMIISLLSGCGDNSAPDKADTSETESQTITEVYTEPDGTDAGKDYKEVYGDILNAAYALAASGEAQDEPMEGLMAINDLALYDRNALDTLGYAIKDISGDGVPELLLGVLGSPTIYSVFTCVGGKPQLTFEGWYRSNHSYLENGSFFFTGSNGTAESLFGVHTISKDGTQVVWEQFCFSAPDDETGEIRYYSNTTGSTNPDESTDLELSSSDDFFSISDQMGEDRAEFDLIPLAEIKNTSAVMVAYSRDYDIYSSKYDTLVIGERNENSSKIVFYTHEYIRDFKVMEISLQDVDENGNPTFSTDEVYSATLTEEIPLVVTLTFYGDTPSYGISYIDKDGTVKNYALSQSGMDGSLILSEY